MFITISDTEVEASEFTRAGHTCLGAMGYSFAAGTTDGERYRMLLVVGSKVGSILAVWSVVCIHQAEARLTLRLPGTICDKSAAGWLVGCMLASGWS